MKMATWAMMTAKMLCAGTLVLGSAAAWADNHQHEIALAKKNPVQVRDIAQLSDDSLVALRGRLVQHVRGDHYIFADKSGKIEVEIDDDVLSPRQVQRHLKQKNHTVYLLGEVDTHPQKPTQVEAFHVEFH